ncbi:MAG: hypothetical protein WBP12_01200 [Candidatus Saccharimonas sp.]
MIVLSELDPLLIFGVGIVSLLLLLLAFNSYQSTNVASGLVSHAVAFIGYAVAFTYLWQTVGSYGYSDIWLAALMAATLVLFLAPLDYLRESDQQDNNETREVTELDTLAESTPSMIDDLQ